MGIHADQSVPLQPGLSTCSLQRHIYTHTASLLSFSFQTFPSYRLFQAPLHQIPCSQIKVQGLRMDCNLKPIWKWPMLHPIRSTGAPHLATIHHRPGTSAVLPVPGACVSWRCYSTPKAILKHWSSLLISCQCSRQPDAFGCTLTWLACNLVARQT